MPLILFGMAVIASIIGAITGVGGGIVLKTFYDLFDVGSVMTISVYATVLVFTMCIVSILKQLKKGFKFNLLFIVSISLGAILGGYAGNYLLVLATQKIPETTVKLIQSLLLLIILVFLIIYTKKSSTREFVANENSWLAFCLGLVLGTVSIFLAIGGGPLNVSLLIIVNHFKMRQAAVYSLATVFFSQISKLFTIVTSIGQLHFQASALPLIIIAGILSGYLGTLINQKLSNQQLEACYSFFMVGLCLLTGFNVIRFWG